MRTETRMTLKGISGVIGMVLDDPDYLDKLEKEYGALEESFRYIAAEEEDPEQYMELAIRLDYFRLLNQLFRFIRDMEDHYD